MKALSLRQPWAQLVALGLKTVELRTWGTEYRGRLLIHASQKVDQRAAARFALGELPTGALLGVVRLVDVLLLSRQRWAELADRHLDAGAYVPGFHGWILDDPEPLDHPVPYRGRLGLFEVSQAAIAALLARPPRQAHNTMRQTGSREQ